MVSKTFSLLFYLKKRKSNKSGPIPIYMRITVDLHHVEISTKRKCEPERWNSRAGKASGTKEDVKVLNAYLDSLQRKVYEVQRFLLDGGDTISAEKIKGILTGIAERPRMILEVFQQHNEQMAALVGNGFAHQTLKRYKTSIGNTRAFIKWKYKVSDLEITKLNYEFLSEYEFYLRSVRKCAHNSTMKYLSNFKKIVHLCVKKDWLSKDPFYGFKLVKKEVNKEFLTQGELQALTNKKIDIKRLDFVRDIFLFSCYTGLSYADVHKLKRSEIAIGVDGQKWIFTYRQKEGTPSKIPLLPGALAIVKKYIDHPMCVNKGLVLPVLSNQKMNGYLKEIADLCGIQKAITFHCARHTFATTVTLSNGVPIETVSKMLGHTNLRTTQHYAKILDRKVAEDMRSLRLKLNPVELKS
jgi:site-specific recombinase XerD